MAAGTTALAALGWSYHRLWTREKSTRELLEAQQSRVDQFEFLRQQFERLNDDLKAANEQLQVGRDSLVADFKEREHLLSVTQSFNRTLELQDLLRNLLDDLNNVVPNHSASIFLYNQDKTELILAASKGFYAEEQASQLQPEMGVPAIVGQTCRPLLLVDLESDPRFSAIARSTRVQSALYHPIALEGTVYGVLSLWHREREAYTKKHVDLLDQLCAEAGRAIRNAEMYAELGTRLNFIVTLWETSKNLTSSVDLRSAAWEQTLEQVITSVRYLFAAEKAVFFRYDKDSHGLVPQKTQGISDEGGARLAAFVNQDVAQQPFFLHSTFQVEDCQKDERFAALAEVAGRENLVSLLWSPLVGRSMTVGTLALLTEKPRVWSVMELQWADIFAKMFSMTLENIFLFQDLASEKMQLQVLVDNMPEGVFTTDTAGRVLTWNAAAHSITGWSLAEVQGQSCSSFIKCQTVDEVWCQRRCPMRAAMDRQQKSDTGVDSVFVLTRGGDHVVPVFLTSAPLYNEEGKVSGAIVVFRDITKEREIEQMKEDFLATITHDLKSPLASVMGYTELLLNPKLGDINRDQRDFLEAIIRSSKTLQFLIDNILEITRMEAGQMLFNPGMFNLESLLGELHEMFRPLAAPKNLRMEVVADGQLVVYGDRDKMKEVFINLLSNAIKFTPAQGQITMRALPDETGVTIMVSDTGKGIPQDQIDRLFQKFAQLKSDERRGTGLGLYIVKRIMDAHGEIIRVESQVGVGTTFIFRLPKFKPDEPGQTTAPAILVLERDRQQSDAVRRTLQQEGLTAISANTTRDALQLLHEQRPRVFVLDSRQPASGLAEYLKEFKSMAQTAGYDVRVLLISEWREEIPSEADAYITRPVVEADLLRKVHLLLSTELP